MMSVNPCLVELAMCCRGVEDETFLDDHGVLVPDGQEFIEGGGFACLSLSVPLGISAI